jgi:hypothetical protein
MRSKLLTYWTGRGIQGEATVVTDEMRVRYVDRLRDILSNGFWMTVPDELLVGHAGPDHPARIEYQTPMTCFTELRLSRSRPHRSRYGLLGVVVDRMFVLQRSGGPVQYLRCHHDEPIVGNLALVFDWLNDQIKAGIPRALDVRHALFFQAAFLKRMSNANTDDFAYLDELEWRIVHTDHQTVAGRLVPTRSAQPPYRIPLTPDEVRMVIVPDEQVRADAMPLLQTWAKDKLPPVLTVDEAEQF